MVKILTIAYLAILSLILNTICCSFSPIHELVGSYDSAVFYMCGKAMAHGYIPYEDFIDVKGPLLLLIFELGYYLSPGKSDGLWLCFSLFTFSTCFFLYKTADIFLSSLVISKLTCVACVMAVVYRPSISGSGAQPEMLMLPFLSGMLYALIVMSRQVHPQKRTVQLAGILTGLGIASSLLIKFNISFPFVVMELAVPFYLRHRKETAAVGPYILNSVIAALIIICPVVLYLLYFGCLSACLQNYGILNFITYFGSHNDAFFMTNQALSMTSLLKALMQFLSRSWPALISVICLMYQQFSTEKTDHFKLPILPILFICATFLSSLGHYEYYAITTSAFPIVACILLTYESSPFSQTSLRNSICTRILLSGILCFIITSLSIPDFRKAVSREDIKMVNTVLTESKKNPKLLYLRMIDRGYGQKDALPACPAYYLPNGAPTSIKEAQFTAIRTRQADFVFIAHSHTGEEKDYLADSSILKQAGYIYRCSVPDYFKGRLEVWGLQKDESLR